MPPLSALRSRVLVPAVLAVLVLAGVGVYYYFFRDRETSLPAPGSPTYEAYVDAFQNGTAALDSGSLNERALEKLTEAVETVPLEPAGWANRGICYLRIGDEESRKKAAEDLKRAGELAPGNGTIEEALSYVSENDGKLDEAVGHVRAALKANPDEPRLKYRLAGLLEKSNKEGENDPERERLLDEILASRPKSLFLLSERISLAVRRQDRDRLRDSLDRLRKLSGEWKRDTRETLAILRRDAEANPLPRDLIHRFIPLQNLLRQEAGYARDAEEISPRTSAVGTTFQTFIRLTPVHTTPAPPDLELDVVKEEFRPHAKARQSERRGDQVVFPVWLNGRDNPVLLVADAAGVHRADAAGPDLAFPSGEKKTPPTIAGVLAIDWNNDELVDLLFAGAGGLRFWGQAMNKGFEDVTAKTKLPAAVLEDDYFGAWAADYEMDGDLDVIAARRKGAPLLLRNNFDGTFTPLEIFPGVEGARAFAWVDLDNDGAPDAVFLDASGRLHVFMNKRSGVFQRRAAPEGDDRYVALAVADVNDDGVLDVIALRKDGTLFRISDKDQGRSWEKAELGKLTRKLPLAPGEVRLVAVDLDNNGAVDVVLRTNEGGQVWLADGKGAFQALEVAVPEGTADVVSLDCSGRLDFLGWERKQKAQPASLARWVTKGTKDYRWHKMRARSSPQGTGDNRVNSQGIGSTVEIRTGTLVVKQPIDRPVVHFGLGNRKGVSVMRVVWTNGAAQFEFDKEADSLVTVGQRLGGSCPFLFTWDGKKMVFVTDFCWSTPLGMRINAQDQGDFAQTTDWVKIRGNQLAPRDGYYDVRVNANLWETHFLDHLSLVVVDHPPNTEMHVDERFFLTPTKPQVYLTGPSKPVAKAWDHQGRDVTSLVRSIDGKYLDRAGRGTYQGVTADHWVEVDLGDDAPKEGPVYLLAHGWIHPTDSSINRAMEQTKHVRPTPLTLEVPNGKGGWKVALPALGFPAGKNKTCVIRLDGIEGKGVTRRFRLRTNLEIFWDALHYAVGLDDSLCKRTPLQPTKADLHFRGMVRISQASPSAPELPHYDDVVCRTQYWRDLTGFHTRFGDVRELLKEIDDRYVIMNAGDEIRLRFKAPPPPRAGWKRDFVWVCDGWVKDGNPNTRFGATVLPLPYHRMKGYDVPPGRLQDDPVYKQCPKDWEIYHTRYVTPTVFERGLRNFRRPGR
jgi:hypothetical protein